MESPSTYRFGDFELDVRAYRLTRGGLPVKLEPKAFDALLCLLRRRGEVVSRRDLVAEVWGGIAITDNAVARVVAHLRRGLDDHPDRPRFIRDHPDAGLGVRHVRAQPARQSPKTVWNVGALTHNGDRR